jgi:hypothetical protein
VSRWDLGRYRFFRHDYPGDGIGKQTNAGHHGSNQPYYAYEGDVEVEVFSNARADSRNFAARPRTDETLASDYAPDSLATICAMIGVVLDYFATVVAVHDSLLTGQNLSLPLASAFTS